MSDITEELLRGVRFIGSSVLTVGPFEDWSEVRSPGRARRRRNQGKPQRIRIYYLPDPKLLRLPDGTIVGHPVTLDHLAASLRARAAA